ncbi:hypothetical protein Mapa_000751 [Marchantia paleacea]|nr:hypothetical protein Mapa_000751 [Marchantia paleacea]
MRRMMAKKGSDRMVVVSMQALVALLCVVAAYIEICDAAAVVDVYRMIQYDFQGTPFGSRRAVVNHHASSGLSVPGSDLSRTIVILPIDKVNVTLLNEYLQSRKMLGGLLLILPRNFENGGKSSGESDSEDSDGDQPSDVAALEQWLIHNNIPYPVYFAYSDERIDSVLKDVQFNDAAGRPATASTGGYKLVVPVSDAKKLPSASYTNIQGWLWGLKGDGDIAGLPTIAIVASYDTFGAAPALAVGSDSNGSGVVALLELARLFSRLYANSKTRAPYNLLFGLTSGGPFNYNGTARWLRGFDQRVRENIDYALCLNSIGNADNMRLHVSKPPENLFIKQIYDNIADVAKDFGVTVEVKHKKINISNSRVAWEHEQFSRHRITAATLSGLETAPSFLDRVGGIADRRYSVNDTVVARNIKIVAESLAKHIYGLEGKNIEVFADGSSLAVSPPYVKLWLDLLSRTPRVAPFLGKNAPIIAAIQKLAVHTKDVSLQHDNLDGTFLFYDTIKAQLSIYQVASVTFDLFIMLAVGSYLGILFLVLVITTKGFDDLVGAFRRPPSRKLKGN